VTEPITWTNETRKLSDLIPWDVNPRQLTEKQAEHLQKSLRKFGLAQPFLISPDNDIYDGHQRTKLMDIMNEYGHDADIDCRMSSRLLTDDERRELVIRLHENTGEWDWDTVPNLYEVEELGDWGMAEWKIPAFDIGEPPDLDELADEYGDPLERDFWPFIRVQVSPETFQLWQSFMNQLPGEDEARKAGEIIGAVDATVFSTIIS